MTIRDLDIAEPFFTTRLIEGEARHEVTGKTIVLNLSDRPLRVRDQSLGSLQSVILRDTEIEDIDHAVIVERFADHDDEDALMARVRDTWPSAFEVRGEERLRGIGHYMSPKVWIGQIGFTMYHSATVPLNVGLHRDHAFCPVPGFREVHTQIVGFGKMQQCRERDIDTLYLEELMAPGTTHRPMYDAEGNYPWHQFETITPSIFMAVEMLPEGATPPEL
jgi:hypothetical protein